MKHILDFEIVFRVAFDVKIKGGDTDLAEAITEDILENVRVTLDAVENAKLREKDTYVVSADLKAVARGKRGTK